MRSMIEKLFNIKCRKMSTLKILIKGEKPMRTTGNQHLTGSLREGTLVFDQSLKNNIHNWIYTIW